METSTWKNIIEDFFIFGYGSLIWNPGFEHTGQPIVGFVCDYARRFYQGSKNFRGTPDWPGRVATLIVEPHSKTWGLMYRITQPQLVSKALEHLIEREMIAGEYQYLRVNFHPFRPALGDENFPRDVLIKNCACVNDSGMITAITYVAVSSNSQYLGRAAMNEEGFQIAFASGQAGSNVDYVERIAQFYEDFVPNGLAEDSYLKEIIEYLEIFKSTNEIN